MHSLTKRYSEKLDVFSVCLAAELYVAATNSSPEIVTNGIESRYCNIQIFNEK